MIADDVQRHHRLAEYDDSQSGACFINAITQHRACHQFGSVVNGKMQWNGWGQIARQCWFEIPAYFANVWMNLPVWTTRVWATRVGATHASPLRGTAPSPTANAPSPTATAPSPRPPTVTWPKTRHARQRNGYKPIMRNKQEQQRIAAHLEKTFPLETRP